MADEVERRETVVVERDNGAVVERRGTNPLWIVLAIVGAIVILSLLFGWPFGSSGSSETDTGTEVPTTNSVTE